MRTALLLASMLHLAVIPITPDNWATPDVDQMEEDCTDVGGFWNLYENATHDASWYECDEHDDASEVIAYCTNTTSTDEDYDACIDANADD